MSDKFSRERVKGYLHTDGSRIVNGVGETIILQGFGIANWLNPEGFMIGGPALLPDDVNPAGFTLPRRFERGRTMETTVRELCGSVYADNFGRRWREEYFTEEDVRLIAELGYNSIRVPISARLFMYEEPGIQFNEENFRLIDRMLDWCEKYRIYVILDMHGAPGGQSGLACDDGIDNRPHTLTEPESHKRTVLLWEEIAKRYADRWIVGAYDLLNEPISAPGLEDMIPEVQKLYDEIIEGIRRFDRKHMLTIEGEVFSAGLRVFEKDYDPEFHNWCIHVHIYGFSPERRDLYRFLDAALSRNVPVWIGEGGSDNISNAIFYEIAADYNIGFSTWCWKSAFDRDGRGAGLVKYHLKDSWKILEKYFTEGGPRPSYLEAQEIFDEMLACISIDQCTIDEERSRYLRRTPDITLPAVGFEDLEESRQSKGWIYGNTFNYRPESRMKMVRKPGALPKKMLSFLSPHVPDSPTEAIQKLCLELREGEFASYTVRSVQQGCCIFIEGRNVCGKVDETDMSFPSVLTVQTESSEKIVRIPIENTKTSWYKLMELPECQKCTVRIGVSSGCVQLDRVRFR